jgi:hypothetical protein
MKMSDASIDATALYAMAIALVRKNPGHNAHWYSQFSDIPNVTVYLNKAVDRGVLRVERSLPMLGGDKYYTV